MKGLFRYLFVGTDIFHNFLLFCFVLALPALKTLKPLLQKVTTSSQSDRLPKISQKPTSNFQNPFTPFLLQKLEFQSFILLAVQGEISSPPPPPSLQKCPNPSCKKSHSSHQTLSLPLKI